MLKFMTDTRLNYSQMGKDDRPPVVCLHGFAGDLSSWTRLQVGLSSSRRSLAFDLPGHGGSLDYPKTCNAVVAAKAVLADLEALGVSEYHLVGHSMGGAAAAIMALKEPDRVRSLTLLAPGGFGSEINQSLLRYFAKATDPEQIHMLLCQFFGSSFNVPFAMATLAAEQRQKPGVSEALQATAEAILSGKEQKVLPLEEIGALPVPVKVIWGREDRVLPLEQVRHVPALVAQHLFDKVGHMPHLEVGRQVLALVRQNARAGDG